MKNGYYNNITPMMWGKKQKACPTVTGNWPVSNDF